MKKRFLIAIPLLALMFSVIFFRGLYFGIIMVIVSLIAQSEMVNALKKANFDVNPVPSIIFVLGMYPAHRFLGVEAVFMLFMIMNLYNLIWSITLARKRFIDAMVSAFMLYYPALLLYSLIYIGSLQPEAYSIVALALALVVPVLSDTGAYFIGSQFGKRKLIPSISPSKTVEGAIGGLVTVLIAALLVIWAVPHFDLLNASWSGYQTVISIPWYHWMICATLCAISAQAGDLAASAIKRYVDIKDYSNLFPGHGGMLDRLDSILFSVTVALIYFKLFII